MHRLPRQICTMEKNPGDRRKWRLSALYLSAFIIKECLTIEGTIPSLVKLFIQDLYNKYEPFFLTFTFPCPPPTRAMAPRGKKRNVHTLRNGRNWGSHGSCKSAMKKNTNSLGHSRKRNKATIFYPKQQAFSFHFPTNAEK